MERARYTPNDLLDAYNTIVTAKGLPPLRMSAKAHGELQAFGKWCAAHEIAPDVWIHATHAARGWRFRIPIGKLISTKFLMRFKEREFGSTIAIMNAAESREVTPNTPLWDDELNYMGEGMKRAVVSDRVSCIVNIAFTGGWNPRSELCRSCPVSAMCKAHMPSDVLARRERYAGGE